MRSFNIGFDLGMFNNRLNLSLEYFRRKTLDIVGPGIELPAILGAAVPDVNNADMQSTGFELDLSWQDRIRDFSYNVHFLLSDDRQKILRYPNPTGNLRRKRWTHTWLRCPTADKPLVLTGEPETLCTKT